MLTILGLMLALASTSFVPYRTSSGVPLRWDAEAIIEVHVGASPDQAIDAERAQAIVADALALWLDTPCPDTARVDLRPDTTVLTDGGALDEDDGKVGVVWIPDRTTWNQRFGTTELARTILLHRSVSGEIVDADVVINFGTYLFAAGDACAPDVYDLAATLTHELGHVLGLDHSDVPSATMARAADPGECDKRTLDPDDLAGICASYSALARPEPDPEPAPEPLPEAAVEPASPERDARDEDGCASGGTTAPWLALLAVLGPALCRIGIRSARRATDGCRPARRPSRARS